MSLFGKPGCHLCRYNAHRLSPLTPPMSPPSEARRRSRNWRTDASPVRVSLLLHLNKALSVLFRPMLGAADTHLLPSATYCLLACASKQQARSNKLFDEFNQHYYDTKAAARMAMLSAALMNAECASRALKDEEAAQVKRRCTSKVTSLIYCARFQLY